LNILKAKNNKGKIFYWLLSLVLITLPFPKYNLNSQCIIALAIFWLFFNSFSEKKKNFKENTGNFFVVSSLFFVSIIGLAYTSNFDQAMSNLKSPFLIFPLIIFTVGPLTLKETGKLLDLFSTATILASLLGLGKALWFHYNGLGEYFYYLDFAKVLNKHTTYFSLFVCISLINIAYGVSLKNGFRNIYRLVAIAFLVFVLYLLSSKVSIICLILTLLISTVGTLIRKNTAQDKMQLVRILILFILPIMFLTPNLKERIFREKASNLGERILLWNAIMDNYLEHNLIFGAGTGDGHKGLVDSYKEIHYDIAARDHYNAHNQYLEQLLFYGILGLILLVVLLLYTFHVLISKGQPLFFLIFFCFLLYMFSESILERHSGLVLFSFLTSIFLSTFNGKSAYAESQHS